MRTSARSLRQAFVMVFGLALVLAIGLTQAHGEIFLDLDGIGGSCLNANYEGWCQIEGFGISVAFGSGDTEPQFSPMWITKQTDYASPYIMQSVVEEWNLGYADIYIDSSGDQGLWTVHWQLEDLLVTSLSSMAGSDPSFAGEKFSLDFGTILYEYQEYDEYGESLGTVSYEYDKYSGGENMTITGSPKNFQFVTQAGVVPEPSTFVLLGMGAFALALYRRLRK